MTDPRKRAKMATLAPQPISTLDTVHMERLAPSGATLATEAAAETTSDGAAPPADPRRRKRSRAAANTATSGSNAVAKVEAQSNTEAASAAGSANNDAAPSHKQRERTCTPLEQHPLDLPLGHTELQPQTARFTVLRDQKMMFDSESSVCEVAFLKDASGVEAMIQRFKVWMWQRCLDAVQHDRAQASCVDLTAK